MNGHIALVLRRIIRTGCPKNQNVCPLTFSLNRCRRYAHHESRPVLGSDSCPVFKPRKAVVLSRITRYEFENLRYKVESDEELKLKLEKRKSDYQTVLDRHNTHYTCVAHIENSLKAQGIETKVVKRPQYNSEILEWADVIFTAGGDGTFLEAASKVLSTDKPVIGINTDPTRGVKFHSSDRHGEWCGRSVEWTFPNGSPTGRVRTLSEGRLCLDKEEYPAMKFDLVLKRLLAGEFKWKWRQRIRITMSGVHANDDPIELSDQQLHFLEHRYSEHVTEEELYRRPLHVKGVHFIRVLPVRALNEVFFGECLSSRVSYYELSIDGQPGNKQKSSGVTVCTGTGSTSWYFHINRIPPESVQAILNIANQVGGVKFPTDDADFVNSVAEQFKNSLIYEPSHPYMGYSVRDPIVNGVFKVPCARGHAKHIRVSSRMWDASLVVDGGCSFRFNDGAIATLEMVDEDALRTVDFS